MEFRNKASSCCMSCLRQHSSGVTGWLHTCMHVAGSQDAAYRQLTTQYGLLLAVCTPLTFKLIHWSTWFPQRGT